MTREINILISEQQELTLEERIHKTLLAIPEYSRLKDIEKLIIDERVASMLQNQNTSRTL